MKGAEVCHHKFLQFWYKFLVYQEDFHLLHYRQFPPQISATTHRKQTKSTISSKPQNVNLRGCMTYEPGHFVWLADHHAQPWSDIIRWRHFTFGILLHKEGFFSFWVQRSSTQVNFVDWRKLISMLQTYSIRAFNNSIRVHKTSASASVCVCVDKNFNLNHNFLTRSVWASYCSCVFLVSRPFTRYKNFWSVTFKFDLHLKNFNLGHNFLTRSDRAFILHMYIPCDKTLHFVS